MDRFSYINSVDNYKKYILKTGAQVIGAGKEGVVYLYKGQTIKLFNDMIASQNLSKNKYDIIMSQDYNVDSYLFPAQLLICENRIVGYISDYFPDNILKYNKSYNADIYTIDIVNLLEARDKLIEDTRIISNDNVKTTDVSFNMLYNNEKLGIVDTFDYYHSHDNTFDDNVRNIDKALLCELHFHDKRFVPEYDKSVEYNLKRIKK